MNIKKVIKFLTKNKVNVFNRWRLMFEIEYINLSYANLRNTDLRNADLRDANLSYAKLSNADLRNANLRYADLSYADLRNADLRNADLRNADLRNANLDYANLSNADLRNANLRNANLSDADLRNANLDFSQLQLSCKSLNAKFDKKHMIQILYHVGMPAQSNNLKLDAGLEKLLNSKMFKNVVNKFHRDDVEKYKGTYKKINSGGGV